MYTINYEMNKKWYKLETFSIESYELVKKLLISAGYRVRK